MVWATAFFGQKNRERSAVSTCQTQHSNRGQRPYPATCRDNASSARRSDRQNPTWRRRNRSTKAWCRIALPELRTDRASRRRQSTRGRSPRKIPRPPANRFPRTISSHRCTAHKSCRRRGRRANGRTRQETGWESWLLCFVAGDYPKNRRWNAITNWSSRRGIEAAGWMWLIISVTYDSATVVSSTPKAFGVKKVPDVTLSDQ